MEMSYEATEHRSPGMGTSSGYALRSNLPPRFCDALSWSFYMSGGCSFSYSRTCPCLLSTYCVPGPVPPLAVARGNSQPVSTPGWGVPTQHLCPSHPRPIAGDLEMPCSCPLPITWCAVAQGPHPCK